VVVKPSRSARLISALLSVALLLTVALASPAQAVTVEVLSQDFTSATFPPTGWTLINDRWTRDASCAAIDATACASITGGTDAIGSFYLKTPAFSTAGLTGPTIDFDVYIADPDGAMAFSVFDSFDCTGIDGMSGGSIHSFAVDAGTMSHQSLALPVRASPFCLRFAFSQDATMAAATVKLDNIVISGDGAAPPPNDPPVAPATKSFTVTEDTAQTLHFPEVMDPNGDPLTLVQTSGPGHGSISEVEFLPGGMSLKYTPNENFDGERNTAGDVFRGDEFKFKVNDGEFDSIETTVAIDMTAVNDAPVIDGPDSASILQDQPWFTFSNGTPGGDAHCTNVGCSATPDVPLGVSDDAPGYSTATGYEVRMIVETTPAAGAKFSLGSTDGLTFSEGDGTSDQRMVFTGLWFAIDSALSAGTVYEPALGYIGSDTLKLTLDDQGQVGLGGGKTTIKEIAINVGAINHRPTADDKSLTLAEDGSAGVTLTGADTDSDTLSFAVETQPTHGDLTGTPPSLTYTPDPNFVGSDSFTYTTADAALTSFPATVSITVTAVTDPPVIGPLAFAAIEDQSKNITLTPTSNQDNVPLTWEIGPAAIGTLYSNGALIGIGVNTLSSPNLTYVPAKDHQGPDYFAFRAKATIDGAPFVSDFFLATINVANINDPPVAKNQVITMRPGEVVPITLEAKDVDGDPLTFKLLNQPNNGTLTGTPPNLIYTAPNVGWHTSFGFEVSDGKQTAFGSVEIKVTLEQPDAMIRLASDEFSSRLGYNIFNADAVGQTLAVDAPLGKETDIAVDIFNPGFFAQKFLVQGTGGPQGWTIRYLLGGQDVSSALYAGKEFEIGSNSFLQLTMRVTPPSGSQAGQRFKAFVTATSQGEERNVDAVAADIRAGTFQPDVLVKEDGGRHNALGDNVYNDTGAQQTINKRGAAGQTVYAHFFVENDGTTVDDFVLKGDIGPGVKWLRQISNDTDVTSGVDAGTYVVENLFPGQVADMLLVYVVPDDFTGTKAYRLTATSVAKGNSDTAIAELEAFGAGQPDLRLESDQRYSGMYGPASGGGNDIYNTTGAGQSTYELLHPGSSNVYMIELENDSNVTSLYDFEPFRMRACSGIDCRSLAEWGLHAKFYELNPRDFTMAEGNNEITAEVLAGQEIEAPPRALADRVWLEVSADANAPIDTSLELSMLARAVGAPEKQDWIFVNVRTVKFRPDVEVIGGSRRTGANIYGSSDAQTLNFDLASKDTQEFTFTVENDVLGHPVSHKDLITVAGTPSGNGFSVQYLDSAGRDITTQLTSTGWYRRMAQGEVVTFKALVTSPSKSAPGTSWPLKFTATSHSSSDTNSGTIGTPGPIDVGGALMKVVYRPDAAVSLDKGLQVTPVVGDGVYDPIAAGQELSADAKILNTQKYLLKLSNDAPVGDTLRASLDGKTEGFDVKVFDAATDVTSKLRDGSYSVALPAGGVRDLSMTVVPNKKVHEGARLTTTLTVNSVTRPLGEPDAARIITSAVISCDETSVKVGVVQIEGDCIMKTDTGYLSQEPLDLNGVELSLFGPPAIIDKAKQTLATDEAELRFADYAIDTVVRIPVTLDGVVKTLCDEFLLAEDWRNGASTCARSGAKFVGEPLGLSAGDWLLTGNVNHLGQEPWGYVFGNRLPTNTQESWQHVLTWQSDGTPQIDLPVPPPDAFTGPPATLPFTIGSAPPRYVEVEFGTLNIDGLKILTFSDAIYRQYLDTGERLLYGSVGFPRVPKVGGFQFGAKFESGGTPEWIIAMMKPGQVQIPIVPPYVNLKEAQLMIEDGPVIFGKVSADMFKLLDAESGAPNALMTMNGVLAYDNERIGARGTMYLLGVIGPLADAKVTAGSGGARATMDWNYSVGLGSIDFGGDIGTLDLGRLGFNASLDGAASDSNFQIEGTGALHVFDSNVGLNAVISTIGAAGCASSKISSFEAGKFGVGVKWDEGGSPSLDVLTDCSLVSYKDPNAPVHIDFAGIEQRFKAHLAEADIIEQLINSLPDAAKMFNQ
jgi:hypothetical protein